MSDKGQCIRCGDIAPRTATICSSCGSRLPWAQVIDANRDKERQALDPKPLSTMCCGKELPTGTTFCPNCGKKGKPVVYQELQSMCCGKELSANAKFCPVCGKRVVPSFAVGKTKYPAVDLDEPYWLFNLIGFLFPIAGLIIWLVIKDDAPRRGMSALFYAGIGFLIGMAFVFLARVG